MFVNKLYMVEFEESVKYFDCQKLQKKPENALKLGKLVLWQKYMIDQFHN